MVVDLYVLLTAADVPGPFALAGHSFGGLIARLYACVPVWPRTWRAIDGRS
jgi:alpha-beta hydrolase superfamily lysophospholipase